MGVRSGVGKTSTNKFSEWCLPIVEIVGVPPIKIFKLSRVSQLPYKVKISKTFVFEEFYIFYMNFPISLLGCFPGTSVIPYNIQKR